MAESSLKSRNLKYLAAVLAVDVIILSALDVKPTFDPFSGPLATVPATGLLTVIAALVLSWIVPPNLKHSLVHWRTRHVLPGHRAFSELAAKDSRIDIDALRGLVGGELPTDPGQQDRVWFKLYKARDSEPAISETHQRVLFFRDAAAISLFLSLIELVIALVCWNGPNAVAALVLLVQYLLFMVAGRHAGERLVQSVMASASAGGK